MARKWLLLRPSRTFLHYHPGVMAHFSGAHITMAQQMYDRTVASGVLGFLEKIFNRRSSDQ